MQSEREVMPQMTNRFGSLFEGWCNRCGKPAGVMRLEEMALAGISLKGIRRRIEDGRMHLTDASDESLLVCFNSLFDH
jgi:hypothetical protein